MFTNDNGNKGGTLIRDKGKERDIDARSYFLLRLRLPKKLRKIPKKDMRPPYR